MKNTKYKLEMLKWNIDRVAEIDNQLRELMKECGTKGISYDSIGGSVGGISDPVHNIAMKNITTEQKLLKEKAKLTEDINDIIVNLEYLTDLQQKIILARYYHRKKWKEIATKLECSEVHCNKEHKKAISILDSKIKK